MKMRGLRPGFPGSWLTAEAHLPPWPAVMEGWIAQKAGFSSWNGMVTGQKLAQALHTHSRYMRALQKRAGIGSV